MLEEHGDDENGDDRRQGDAYGTHNAFTVPDYDDAGRFSSASLRQREAAADKNLTTIISQSLKKKETILKKMGLFPFKFLYAVLVVMFDKTVCGMYLDREKKE